MDVVRGRGRGWEGSLLRTEGAVTGRVTRSETAGRTCQAPEDPALSPHRQVVLRKWSLSLKGLNSFPKVLVDVETRTQTR